MAKFELVREPAETWAVLDTEENQPAEDNGKVLIGLSHEDAALAASRLNLALLRLEFSRSRKIG
jgi:hypothetical protein